MSKIFIAFFITIFITLSMQISYAEKYLKIIPRSEWGADETYNYWNSETSKQIFVQWSKNKSKSVENWDNLSEEEKAQKTLKSEELSKKQKSMNEYLSKYFSDDVKITNFQRYNKNGEKLAWAYQRTNYIKNIVIHHTYSDYNDSSTGIKEIYAFHSLNRQWFDIGYNYIIGYNGEVFEGRSGGDYTVGAHDTWNNRSTLGIAIMGNYDKGHLKESQYNSLKKLVSHLTKTYGIDLNKKIPYHKECFGLSCKNGLETNYYFPIVGHKDGKATSCPGHHNYTETIPRLLKELQPQTAGYKKISYSEMNLQKEEYRLKLENLNWERVEKYLSSKTEAEQKTIKNKLKYLSQREIGWKNKMLIKKALREIN